MHFINIDCIWRPKETHNPGYRIPVLKRNVGTVDQILNKKDQSSGFEITFYMHLTEI